MRFSYPATLLSAAAITVQSAMPLSAQDSSRPNFWQVFTVENIATALLHSTIGWARILADIRYDQISVDPIALRATLTGVTISPNIPGVAPGGCVAKIERLTINGNALDHIDKARFRLALDGVSIPSTCLPVEPGAMMRGFGYGALDIPRIEADFNYDYPSGGANIRISADLDRLATINANIDLAYISYRLDYNTEEPTFAVDLARAEITVSDAGAWDLAKKLAPPAALQPDALAEIAGAAMAEIILEANSTSEPPTAKQHEFISTSREMARGFGAGRRQIVLASQIQGQSLRLDERAFSSFQQLFDRLDPTLTGTAPSLSTAIPVALLSAAMDAENPPANAFEIGSAFITGIGAPLNRANGLRLLVPLARQGNTDASFLIAKAVETSQPKNAYAHALRASLARKPGALALLDRIERGLPFAAIIEEQNRNLGATDTSLYNDLPSMRRAARDYLSGTSRPRSWRAAYYWAAMAAATGDASGAALRDEITETMRLRGDAKDWAELAGSLNNGVLRDWVANDVPALLR